MKNWWIEYGRDDKWVAAGARPRRLSGLVGGLLNTFYRWQESRGWVRRQEEFTRTGLRYYGDSGTIHINQALDVEVAEDGKVVAVWFRCQTLPFKQCAVGTQRVLEMSRAYATSEVSLHGVAVKDPADA
jgi:hypothetical protein